MPVAVTKECTRIACTCQQLLCHEAAEDESKDDCHGDMNVLLLMLMVRPAIIAAMYTGGVDGDDGAQRQGDKANAMTTFTGKAKRLACIVWRELQPLSP